MAVAAAGEAPRNVNEDVDVPGGACGQKASHRGGVIGVRGPGGVVWRSLDREVAKDYGVTPKSSRDGRQGTSRELSSPSRTRRQAYRPYPRTSPHAAESPP